MLRTITLIYTNEKETRNLVMTTNDRLAFDDDDDDDDDDDGDDVNVLLLIFQGVDLQSALYV